MSYVTKAVNFIKDAFVWQADFVESYNWTTVAIIWALAAAVVIF